MLEKLGLSVCRVSALSILVEAPVSTFEAAFGAQLKRVGREQQLPGQRKANRDSVGEEQHSWAWSEPPKIPKGLSDLVDTLVFPQPTRTMTG